MILVMKKGVTEEEILQVMEGVKSIGMDPRRLDGVERTIIACIGEERDKSQEYLASLPGVERVIPILHEYKLAARESAVERTKVKVGDVIIGGREVVVMAGPCSVESEEQILKTAWAVKEAGGKILRGGAFKPRTSPYSFQGLAEEGLKLLARARKETGLPVVTEVMDTHDVELVIRYADMLQIGARNVQNFALLKKVGQTKVPVLLKRGLSTTLKEFLMAAEYILSGGNPHVVLCERGIRTFETATRNTLDLNAVPVLKEWTHLPVAVDPSHGVGITRWVPPLARAAVACGADALMIEVHPDPPRAVSDGAQSLDFPLWKKTMEELHRVAEAIGRRM
jgi:3-deoxy-7-phosphoheptulonate synthase